MCVCVYVCVNASMRAWNSGTSMCGMCGMRGMRGMCGMSICVCVHACMHAGTVGREGR